MRTHSTMVRILALAMVMMGNNGAGAGAWVKDGQVVPEGTEGATFDSTVTATEEVKTAAEVAAEAPKKEKQLIPNITRGRMPIAVVAQVRFGDQKNEATKALATMFGTTVGKIDDIKKNRNFAYVTAAFRPTQAQKDEGIAWLQKHVDFEKGSVDKLINELEATEVATTEEAAAFESVRVAARGQNTTTKTGEVANAGGGNRIKPKKEKAAPEEKAAVAQPSAGELLA